MLDFLETQIIIIAIVSLLILMLKQFKLVDIELKWAFTTITLIILYALAVYTGGDIIPIETIYPDAKWNWGGKLLAIILWVVVLFLLIKVKKNFNPSEAGFTFKQNQNSTKPAIIALILCVLFQILVSNLAGENNYDTEELLYQASMPGLDEEPMFRGVLLYLLSLAIPSKRMSIFGASINIAGLMLTIIFGMVHGLWQDGGEWHFSMFSASITGLYGFIFLWFREKTGSLLFPILAHNSVNFVGQFEFNF